MQNDQLSLFDVFIALVRYRRRIVILWTLFAFVGGMALGVSGRIFSRSSEPEGAQVRMEQSLTLLPLPDEIARLTGYSFRDNAARILRSPAVIGAAVRAAAELVDTDLPFPQTEAEFYGYIADSFVPHSFSFEISSAGAEVKLMYTGPDENFASTFLQEIENRFIDQVQQQQYELLLAAERRIAAYEAALIAQRNEIDDAMVVHRRPSVPVRYSPQKNGMPLAVIAGLLGIAALAASLTVTAVTHAVQAIRNNDEMQRRLQEAWRAGKARRSI